MAKLVRKKSTIQEPDYYPPTRRIASLALDKKAKNVKAYDVNGLTLIADSFVMCSATSDPHVKAVYNSIVEGMKEIGVKPRRSEGGYKDGWLILDFGSIIVHVFKEETRGYYDLDALWGDAPEIALPHA